MNIWTSLNRGGGGGRRRRGGGEAEAEGKENRAKRGLVEEVKREKEKVVLKEEK